MSSARTVGPPTRHRARSGGLTAFGVALAIGVTACSGDGTPSTVISAPSGSVSVAPLPALSPIACDPGSATPGETVTRDPGSYRSGLAVVADYHWSIITARDAERAKLAIRPGNAMGTDQLIGQALDGFPVGSTYCLRMRQTAPNTVLLTLTTRPPSGGTTDYRLRATVDGQPGDVRLLGEVPQ